MKKNTRAKRSFVLLENKLKDIYINPDMFKDWLKKQLNFTNYSTNNRYLIYFQKPDAKYVASYNKWKELGFPVIKSGGIKILCPVLLEVFRDDSGKCKLVKEATESEKELIKNGKISTAKILHDYIEKTVFDIDCTNATEKDLVDLKIIRDKKISKLNIEEISSKLSENLNIKCKSNNPYENIYDIVKTYVKNMANESNMFDDDTTNIITEAVTYSVLSQMHIDTTLFEFKALNNLNYEKDAETLSKVSNEICNATDYMVNMLMKIF